MYRGDGTKEERPMDVIDLRSAQRYQPAINRSDVNVVDLGPAQPLEPPADAGSSSGVAVAYALLAFVGCCVGALAGAVLF